MPSSEHHEYMYSECWQACCSIHMCLVKEDYLTWRWVVIRICIEPISVPYIDECLATIPCKKNTPLQKRREEVAIPVHHGEEETARRHMMPE